MTASPQECAEAFTAALLARDIAAAVALLTDDAVFFYSNGSTITGKDAFAATMKVAWSHVSDYKYQTKEPRWLSQSETTAVLIYDFAWTGVAGGQNVGASGRATRVFRREPSGWRLVHEHLSNKS